MNDVLHAAEAFTLYSLSAGAGNTEGMYSLGWMHATAKGTARNVSLAIQLYKEAVRRAPDWQHAAPSCLAIVLLPCLLILQWSQELFGKQLQQGIIGLALRFVSRIPTQLPLTPLPLTPKTVTLTPRPATPPPCPVCHSAL